MKGDKINDLFKQGMGRSQSPNNFDPKRQKYFEKIKEKTYSKDLLRETFEKKIDQK
jgi:hypothetical protein